MFRKKMTKNIIEYQNEIIEKHCDEVKNIYQQMRSWKHDYHNHLQTIKAYISLGEIDKLTEYCNNLDEDLKDIDHIIKTGNITLDAIINSKLSLASSKDIDVNVKVTMPSNLHISDVDLCVLIGNLLDNAIEACVAAKTDKNIEFDKPFIRLYLTIKNNHLYICITNTAYKKAKKQGNRFLTTKNSDSHGFGLIRIDKICSKYDGYCKRGSEPGAFTTEILLPLQ